MNQNKARGNRNSTIFHKFGINTAHRIKKTFIDIAKVKGSAIKEISFFQFIKPSYKLLLLKSKYFFKFQISILKCKKAKNKIQNNAVKIINWKKISSLKNCVLIVSNIGIGYFSVFLGIINIRYIKNETASHPGPNALRKNIGL